MKEYQAQAEEIFREVISAHEIRYATTSTIEPFYFSLCLDHQKSIIPQDYLFCDDRYIEVPVDILTTSFRKAKKGEKDVILHFYQENTEGPGEWIAAFLHKRLERKELFVCFSQQTLVATGECIPSQGQPPYADLGIVVAQAYRGRGLGKSVLLHLKEYGYGTGLKPICSCAVANLASKKAIEGAGFLSEQRRVKVTFASPQALS